MISPLLLLSALMFLWHEPPKAELVLKESYLISKKSVSSIVPLNQKYLCLSTFAGEIKIFDRLKKEVVLTEDSLQKRNLFNPFLHSLVLHKNHLYAQMSGYLYTYPFEWKDKSKLPTIGPAQLLDLKGDEVKSLWSAGGAALCFIQPGKIFWLEDGRVLWDKFIDVEKLTGKTLKSTTGIGYVWLVTVGTQTKLFVCPDEGQLQVFDFPSLKKEREYPLSHPFDITFSKDRFFFLDFQKLGVMDLQGNIKYSKTYDHREMKYIESKNLLLLWDVQEFISIASAAGEFGKKVKIPAAVCYPFVDGNLVYFGFSSDNHHDEYVGGGYLRVYEIK